jgi:hypothetical protein
MIKILSITALAIALVALCFAVYQMVLNGPKWRTTASELDRELSTLPRPKSAHIVDRRVMWKPGMASVVEYYDSALSREDVIAFYDGVLAARGLRPMRVHGRGSLVLRSVDDGHELTIEYSNHSSADGWTYAVSLGAGHISVNE